ncbi:MAG: membrane protein insertase YidC [Aphanocapsa feldmannii 277cI]|uniref:Membrane protein insertase YidC n=2 Tax=Aphanocapsa feldmannii TaxID=192050 RepID=A0A524RU26_9CHRO|nr:MAG: membrane protein insertase YidC [Aphanocapsa feldmannii 277cI]
MIGFISDNLLLPILDFFYGLIPSYGLAIVALTLVIRLALFPLSNGSIRNARRMRIAQPEMQKRQAEVRSRYADDPQRQQQEMGKIMKEFGNPLSGCLPLLLQMPILFALFATLRGSPFADTVYNINLKVVPQAEAAQLEAEPFNSKSHSIFVNETSHFPVVASIDTGNKLVEGATTQVDFQTKEGESLQQLISHVDHPATLEPHWTVSKGSNIVSVSESGRLTALAPGDASLEARIPGVAAESGFLFIKQLGQVGFFVDGQVNWDIAILVAGFGLTLFLSQLLSGMGMPRNPQQETTNRILPFMMSGMFLFFPLPAGVLLYMVVANMFQAFQTFLLTQEKLPDNLQQLLERQLSQPTVTATASTVGSRRLPFEPGKRKG